MQIEMSNTDLRRPNKQIQSEREGNMKREKIEETTDEIGRPRGQDPDIDRPTMEKRAREGGSEIERAQRSSYVYMEPANQGGRTVPRAKSLSFQKFRFGVCFLQAEGKGKAAESQ